jgi:hypothetical protein
MIEKTQRRLRQARFFYEHLLDPPRTTIIASDAFVFYFSAFIQAARTVTWTLKNEETEKWKAWEPKWRAKRSTDEQKLLDITNEFRIDEEKKGGTNLYVDLEQEALDITPVDSHTTQFTLRLRLSFHYLEDEETKQEATALCRRYLNFLEKMVKDFCEDNSFC